MNLDKTLKEPYSFYLLICYKFWDYSLQPPEKLKTYYAYIVINSEASKIKQDFNIVEIGCRIDSWINIFPLDYIKTLINDHPMQPPWSSQKYGSLHDYLPSFHQFFLQIIFLIRKSLIEVYLTSLRMLTIRKMGDEIPDSFKRAILFLIRRFDFLPGCKRNENFAKYANENYR